VTARRKLLQLAQGVDEADIVAAIEQKLPYIELDPQIVNPNQIVRLTVRFRDPQLNGATARTAIECEWRFHEATATKRWKPSRRQIDHDEEAPIAPQPGAGSASPHPPVTECGWRVHRYFQPGISEQTVETTFFWKGRPITDAGGKPIKLTKTIRVRQRTQYRNDLWDRHVWRPLPQALQLVAGLLVPLAALTATTTGDGGSAQWWELVSLGFGSETIRSILTGPVTPPSA
jgi:hypothetical protein